jgi:dCMP deaminase
MSISLSWHKKYLRLAKHISEWSKDPSTSVGAIAIGDIGQILATGYNGLPRQISDTYERLNTRELKYKYVVHAEMNCIYNATHNGVSLKNSTLYVYGLPICSECAKGVIQVGIKKVIMPFDINTPEKWKESFDQSKNMFDEVGIDYEYVDLRD